MHEAIQYIHEHAQVLRDEHVPSDECGLLTEPARDVLVKSGGMRLLLAESHGGFEAAPADFFAWVRAAAHYNPSAGWTAGVVGVHPWEIALADPKLQDEIFADEPDTWIASPYAPQGRAVRERDGFRFSGEWQYSTGTDHCDWIVLGGIVVDESGDRSGPPDMRHFFLPRGDYEIVDDSWHVMGLSGTGSKDIRIDDAFIPEYRATAVVLAFGQGDVPHRPGGHRPHRSDDRGVDGAVAGCAGRRTHQQGAAVRVPSQPGSRGPARSLRRRQAVLQGRVRRDLVNVTSRTLLARSQDRRHSHLRHGGRRLPRLGGPHVRDRRPSRSSLLNRRQAT